MTKKDSNRSQFCGSKQISEESKTAVDHHFNSNSMYVSMLHYEEQKEKPHYFDYTKPKTNFWSDFVSSGNDNHKCE